MATRELNASLPRRDPGKANIPTASSNIRQGRAQIQPQDELKIIASKNDFVGLQHSTRAVYIPLEKSRAWAVLPSASFRHMNSEWLRSGPK